MTDDDLVRELWAALDGPPDAPERITRDRAPTALDRAALPAAALARATVAVCSLAAAELAAARSGGPVPPVRVRDRAVDGAFRSDRLVRLDGRAPVTFAPLSGFWRAADGWVRTHANYPHHRARLLGALGLPQDAGPSELAAVLAGRDAAATEEAVYAAGGLAVAVRDRDTWARHPQGVAAAAQPLAGRRPLAPGGAPLPPPGREPGYAAAGLRVLDLTRVLAGPVATRTLALLGAEVLRLDAPWLPESQDALDDTGMGKRSARLDLATADGRAAFGRLLERADVVVTGYRPGALEALEGWPRRNWRRAGRGWWWPSSPRGGGPAPGPGGGASTVWCRRRAASPWPSGPPARRTPRPAPCPPRPSTTAPATSWRRRCCAP